MLPSDNYQSVLEIINSKISTAFQIFITIEIIVSIVFSKSLKAMWNLLNVLQVLGYIQFFSGWPIFVVLVLENMDNAINLKSVSDAIYEYKKSKYEIARTTLKNEELKNAGI